MLEFLNARTDIRRKAGEIYGAIVTQARHPALYAGLGVPDTPSGRYEMVVLHLFLVMERLGAKLHNNSGAVVVLVRRSTPDKVLPRITQFGGEVIQTGLGPEREAELQEALAGQAATV